MLQENYFSINRNKNHLSISFASNLENIDLAVTETCNFLTENNLAQDIFSVSLVLREGLINAVKHGNKFDLKKNVDHKLFIQNQNLTIEIEDKGEGFDWRNARNTPPPSDLDHGRGLPIMQHYFSAVKYNEKGNQLTLIKNL